MKNYLICIGGSGARVLRAMVHMSACGLVLTDNIQTVIVDSDKNTITTSFAIQELQDYQNVKKIYQGKRFWKTEINLFSRDNDYVISPNQEKLRNLRELCGAQKDLERAMKWFFKREKLEQELEHGFCAEAAIGAAFFPGIDSYDFAGFLDGIQDVLEAGQEDVNIMLAGSVFGGTGAAGIPVLLRLIGQRLQNASKGRQLFKRLHTGGVLMFPYFSVGEGRSPSGEEGTAAFERTFHISIKGVLQYYNAEGYYGKLSERDYGKFENMYLIGQETPDEVNEYAPEKQKNKAHLAELYGALAISDFFERMKVDQADKRGIYVCARNVPVTWDDFPVPYGYEKEDIRKRLSLMIRFCAFFTSYIYQKLYDPVHQEEGAGLCYRGYDQWYYYQLKRRDEKLKENMDIIRRYCLDFLNWIFEVNAEKMQKEAEHKERLCLDKEGMKLLGDVFEELFILLFPQNYHWKEGEQKKAQEALLKEVYRGFNKIMAMEEKTRPIWYVVARLNDEMPCRQEDYMTELIDRILKGLEEIYG